MAGGQKDPGKDKDAGKTGSARGSKRSPGRSGVGSNQAKAIEITKGTKRKDTSGARTRAMGDWCPDCGNAPGRCTC